MHEALEDTLKSMVIQVQTAFETLSGSLYKCAVNEAKITLPWPLNRKRQPMEPTFVSLGKTKLAYEAGFHMTELS